MQPIPHDPKADLDRLGRLLRVYRALLGAADKMPEAQRAGLLAAERAVFHRLCAHEGDTFRPTVDAMLDLMDDSDALIVEGQALGRPLGEAEVAFLWMARQCFGDLVCSQPNGSSAVKRLNKGAEAVAAQRRATTTQAGAVRPPFPPGPQAGPPAPAPRLADPLPVAPDIAPKPGLTLADDGGAFVYGAPPPLPAKGDDPPGPTPPTGEAPPPVAETKASPATSSSASTP